MNVCSVRQLSTFAGVRMAAPRKVSVARNAVITAEERETQIKIPYRSLVKISHSQFNRISLSPGCLALLGP